MRGQIRKVAWEWWTGSHPPDPTPDQLPLASSDLSPPGADEVKLTWVGHATFLVAMPGLTLLTDPVWSAGVSPIPAIGGRRFVPAAPELDALPTVDAVLLSHDHYDHMDRRTIAALHERFGDGLTWYTPLGYRGWFRRLGIGTVVELDWWDEAPAPVDAPYRITAAPARHWTRRTPWGTNRRLWSSWAVRPTAESEGLPSLYFGGDSAYGPFFSEIADRLGPFDASIIPIGAYEPRWFMKASHMNPEEAVQVYRDLGAHGAFVPSHWGTFRLTFEDPLEPPVRTRAAWAEAGLDPAALSIPRHGETVVVRVGR